MTSFSTQPEYCAVILAAGYSSRMQRQKFGLDFSEKKIFLDQIIGNLKNAGCAHVEVVINKDGWALIENINYKVPDNTSFTINNFPEKGRFYSLKIALANIPCNSPVLIHNVDNPFINQNVILALLKSIDGYDYVYPVFKGKGGHPVLVSKKMAIRIKEEENCGYNIKSFLRKFNGKSVEVDNDSILININTPEDYKKYFGMN